MTKEDELRAALLLILDHVDYTAKHPGCRMNEMVGAVLPEVVIRRAREALKP